MEDNPKIAKKNLKYLLNCKDMDMLILKGHVLTEHTLEYYINCVSFGKTDDFSKFSYYQKLEIAQILGLFKVNNWLKPALKLLNKLRNSIAHNLTYDKNLIKDFLKSYKAKSRNEYEFKNNNAGKVKIDALHFKVLITIVQICGYIEGCSDGQKDAQNEILARARNGHNIIN